MEVKQIYDLMNTVTSEILGDSVIVNEDLSKYAKEIDCPTLLIWGENDTEAPVNEAKELEKIMIDAALIILPGTHYAYLENLNQVVNILNNFF